MIIDIKTIKKIPRNKCILLVLYAPDSIYVKHLF